MARERCNAVLGGGRCRLANAPVEGAAYSALVRPRDADFMHVRVELRRGQPAGPLLQSRELAFSAADSNEDRWGSLGVLIAALVVLWDSKPAEPASADAAPPPHEPPARPPREPGLTPSIDAGVTVSDALARPPLQPGAVLRVALGYEPWRSFGLLGARYARRFGAAPELEWFSVDAGFGTRIGPWQGLWAIELHAEAEWQRLRAFAADSASGRTARAATSRFGLRLGLDGSLAISGGLRALLGFEGAVLRPEVIVDVRDAPADRVPPVALGGFAGLRFSP